MMTSFLYSHFTSIAEKLKQFSAMILQPNIKVTSNSLSLQKFSVVWQLRPFVYLRKIYVLQYELSCIACLVNIIRVVIYYIFSALNPNTNPTQTFYRLCTPHHVHKKLTVFVHAAEYIATLCIKDCNLSNSHSWVLTHKQRHYQSVKRGGAV